MTHSHRPGQTSQHVPIKVDSQMSAELNRQLEEMKRHGIIEKSTLPWHCPIVIVKKPNNERFCVDYPKGNAVKETMSCLYLIWMMYSTN